MSDDGKAVIAGWTFDYWRHDASKRTRWVGEVSLEWTPDKDGDLLLRVSEVPGYGSVDVWIPVEVLAEVLRRAKERP